VLQSVDLPSGKPFLLLFFSFVGSFLLSWNLRKQNCNTENRELQNESCKHLGCPRSTVICGHNLPAMPASASQSWVKLQPCQVSRSQQLLSREPHSSVQLVGRLHHLPNPPWQNWCPNKWRENFTSIWCGWSWTLSWPSLSESRVT
jgi:hypothetical protein